MSQRKEFGHIDEDRVMRFLHLFWFAEGDTAYPQISQIYADSRRRQPSVNLQNLENLWMKP
jgi:hypothetical protein